MTKRTEKICKRCQKPIPYPAARGLCFRCYYKYGRNYPTINHIWTASERELIRRHYGVLSPQPWPIRKLAEIIGKPVSLVRRAAKRYGMVWQPQGKIRTKRLLQLHSQGLNDHEIANIIGCSSRAVFLARKRLELAANCGPGGKRKNLISERNRNDQNSNGPAGDFPLDLGDQSINLNRQDGTAAG